MALPKHSYGPFLSVPIYCTITQTNRLSLPKLTPLVKPEVDKLSVQKCSMFKNVTETQSAFLYVHQRDGYREEAACTFAFTVFETYPQSLYALYTSHFTLSKLKFTYHPASRI